MEDDEWELPFDFAPEDEEFTFNKVAEKKPLYLPAKPDLKDVIEEKATKLDEERCKVCGSYKVKIRSRFNFDGNKFVMRCNICRAKNRPSRAKKAKNETK